jgi:UDP-N-acetylmuramoyl-tripeptide--D-alanyl-D-alanine ligase
MAELGDFSRMLHEESGSVVARGNIALCLAVGEDAKFLVEAAKKIRPGDWVRWFGNRDQLLAEYQQQSQSEDRILVKGSRCEGMDQVAQRLREGKK